MRRPSRFWSRSGVPVAVPTNAVRITTAIASAITAVRPKARRRQPLAKAARARRASSVIAVAADNDFRKPREGTPAEATATPGR